MKYLDALCCRDERSPEYQAPDEWEKEQNINCYCDNCFYGRDKPAKLIIEMLKTLETLQAALSAGSYNEGHAIQLQEIIKTAKGY